MPRGRRFQPQGGRANVCNRRRSHADLRRRGVSARRPPAVLAQGAAAAADGGRGAQGLIARSNGQAWAEIVNRTSFAESGPSDSRVAQRHWFPLSGKRCLREWRERSRRGCRGRGTDIAASTRGACAGRALEGTPSDAIQRWASNWSIAQTEPRTEPRRRPGTKAIAHECANTRAVGRLKPQRRVPNMVAL